MGGFSNRWMWKALGIVVVLQLALSAGAQAKDPWAPLSFLLGNWSGGGSGKPGDVASGSASFSLDLKKNVIIRRNRAEIAARHGDTSKSVHEDLMVIYRQPGDGSLRAVYFDDEGHVINYSVTVS